MRPLLIMLCGIPASSKSTIADKYSKDHKNTIIHSSDALREELFGNVNDQNNNEDDFGLEERRSIEDEIVDVVDIIPVSASSIMERLYEKEITISVPELMGKLMDLTYKRLIIQDGVYYRKRIG